MKKIGILSVLILTLFTSCDFFGALFQPLIGTWENEYETLTFKIIGFEYTNTINGYFYLSGDYMVKEDNLTLSYTSAYGSNMKLEYTYSIDDNVLSLTPFNSISVITFRKK